MSPASLGRAIYVNGGAIPEMKVVGLWSWSGEGLLDLGALLSLGCLRDIPTERPSQLLDRLVWSSEEK